MKTKNEKSNFYRFHKLTGIDFINLSQVCKNCNHFDFREKVESIEGNSIGPSGCSMGVYQLEGPFFVWGDASAKIHEGKLMDQIKQTTITNDSIFTKTNDKPLVISGRMWDGLMREIKTLKTENKYLSRTVAEFQEIHTEPDKYAVAEKMQITTGRIRGRILEEYQKDRSAEARKAYRKLIKQGTLNAKFDFSSSYFGYFKSKGAFAFFKLFTDDGYASIPGKYLSDYKDELFRDLFVISNGHVFIK